MLLALCLLAFPFITIAQFQVPMVLPYTTTVPTLADLLTIEPAASIFYSYARESVLSDLFDGHTPLTVLVPTNKAVIALPRKPHQGPARADESAEAFHERSGELVRRWVSAHLIPEYPVTLAGAHPTLLHNKSVAFALADGAGPEWARVRVDGAIRVVGMKEGMNGVMYLIDGAVSVDDL